MDSSTLHDIYEKDHKGSPLTLDIINRMLKGEVTLMLAEQRQLCNPISNIIMDDKSVKVWCLCHCTEGSTFRYVCIVDDNKIIIIFLSVWDVEFSELTK